MKKDLSSILFASVLLSTLTIYGCSTPQPPLNSAEKTEVTNTAKEEAQVKTEEKEEPKIAKKAVGEEASISGLTFKVNSYKETNTLTAKYRSPVAAREETKFLVINLTITNEGSSGASFFPESNFRVVDADGREFKTFSDSIGALDDYLDMRELAPGIPEKGSLIYELPKNAEFYSLVGFDSNGNNPVMVYLPTQSAETK